MSRQLLSSARSFVSACKTVEVDCPEIDCTVRLRGLTLKQVQQSNLGKDQISEQLALMIVGEDGQPIFTTPEEIRQLDDLPAVVGTRLLEAAAKLNGISQAAIDEAVKNSKASPSADSVSA